MPARSTSRCVTARTRPSGVPLSSTPRARHPRPRTLGRAEDDDVGLGRDDLEAELGEALRQHARVLVVVGEPLDVVVERVQAAGGHDPRLPERAAHLLLPAPRLVDQLARAGEHGAHRRAEALREVEPGGVEAARELRRARARGHHRVHQPRAVHVCAQPVRARHVEHLVHRSSGQTRPPPMFVVCSTETMRERGR